jgi:glycosyltransferase involved in cell wall biosynthesis
MRTIPLTVVIPTFNEETELPYLLSDLVKQNVKFEIIVADAFSTDSTREIAKNFGALVVDGGMPAKGRNAGAAKASGEVLLFLDADVRIFADSFIDNLYTAFSESGAGSATVAITPMSDSWWEFIAHMVYNFLVDKQSKRKPFAPGSIILSKNDIHLKINGFDESIKLAEDHDYVNRAFLIQKFAYFNDLEIFVSVRRLRRDGRWNVLIKYLLAWLHIEFIGPIRTDIFKYRFGYKK